MTLEIGVVGAGNHSRRFHGPALERLATERHGQIALRAVCDLDEQKATEYAEAFGFAETYTDYDRMLDAEDLDAVLAITPKPATRSVAGDLLERDVAVLIEKPPGRSSKETRELLEIADREGAPHMISFNRRFNPAVQKAREWLEKQAYGEPTLAVAKLWRADRLEAPFVYSTGIHAVDNVCSFLGTPASASARRWQSRPEGGETCDGLLEFEGGASAQISLTPDVGRRAEAYEILGPEYSIRIDTEAASLDVAAGGETVIDWTLSPDAPHFERNGTLGEMTAFVDAARGERPFSPDLAEALHSMRAVEALDAGGEQTLD